MLVILVAIYLHNCDSISFTVFSESELFHILLHKFILHIIENKFSKMETFMTIGYFLNYYYIPCLLYFYLKLFEIPKL